MKKIFTLASLATLALIALSSCTKSTPEAPGQVEELQEISFQTAYYDAATKADTHGDLELTSNFKVRAYYTGDAGWANTTLANSVLHMKDVEIGKSGNVWKATSGTYYWPKAGKLSFFGYTGWTGIVVGSWGAEKAGLLSVTETITNTCDPMVADLAIDLSSNPDATHFTSGVPMLFHHTASKVAFLGKTTEDSQNGDGQGLEYKVKINSVVIDDMFTKGTYTLNGTNATISGAWSNPADANDLTYLGAAQELSTTAAALGSLGQITVLPQSVATLNAIVSYTIEVWKKVAEGETKPTDPMATKTFTNIAVPLKTTNISAWEQNKIYTYTIIISPVDGEITFDPAVAPWVNGGSGSATI